MSYNYGRFRAHHYTLEEFEGPGPGRVAPNLSVRTLDGRPVALQDFRGKPVVLETGSVTSPVYAGKVEQMNELAARYPDVHFLLLYVREAHPGSRVRAHRSDEDKAACARLAQREIGEWRPILLDDLQGTMHRRFGEYPNMVYVIDARGKVIYRAKWNDVHEVDAVLRALDGGHPVPLCESTRFVAAPTLSLSHFATGGWDALLDFMVAMPRLMLGNVMKPRLRPDPTNELAW
jgi:peroxiredoxin